MYHSRSSFTIHYLLIIFVYHILVVEGHEGSVCVCEVLAMLKGGGGHFHPLKGVGGVKSPHIYLG